MINDYFDKIYCINLDRRRDKWLDVQKEFVKHSLVVDRFSAIDIRPEAGTHFSISEGAVGCLLSHEEVILTSGKKELFQILILEDDVIFDNDFVSKFEEWYPQVPVDWDMLYLGGNNNGLKVQQISENIGRVTDMFATHAYALKHTIFNRILRELPKSGYQIDVLFTYIQKECNAYCFIPLLAFQKEGYSDVLKSNVDYDFELKRNHDKPIV